MDGLENSLTVSLTGSLIESESTYNGQTMNKKRRNRQQIINSFH